MLSMASLDSSLATTTTSLCHKHHVYHHRETPENVCSLFRSRRSVRSLRSVCSSGVLFIRSVRLSGLTVRQMFVCEIFSFVRSVCTLDCLFVRCLYVRSLRSSDVCTLGLFVRQIFLVIRTVCVLDVFVRQMC